MRSLTTTPQVRESTLLTLIGILSAQRPQSTHRWLPSPFHIIISHHKSSMIKPFLGANAHSWICHREKANSDAKASSSPFTLSAPSPTCPLPPSSKPPIPHHHHTHLLTYLPAIESMHALPGSVYLHLTTHSPFPPPTPSPPRAGRLRLDK